MLKSNKKSRKLRVYLAAPFRRHTNEIEGREYGEINNKELIEFFERIEKLIREEGFETCLPHRDKGRWGKVYIQPKDVAKMCFDSILECDIMVVLAERSRGVHMEIGYAAHAKKTLIIFLKEGEAKSGFYDGLNKETKTILVRYKDDDLLQKMRKALREVKREFSFGVSN